MPVEFLTEEQQHRYGRYTEKPSPLQLARYCHFDDRDRQLINRRQRDHTRLGFAIQLGTVRFLGTFLPNPTAVPENVVAYVAHQLDLEDPDCLSQYASRDTHGDHASQIQHAYGYHDFYDPHEVFRLVRWLYSQAWLSAERPSVLFDLATARLVERKVLLPESHRRAIRPGSRIYNMTVIYQTFQRAARGPRRPQGTTQDGVDWIGVANAICRR